MKSRCGIFILWLSFGSIDRLKTDRLFIVTLSSFRILLKVQLQYVTTYTPFLLCESRYLLVRYFCGQNPYFSVHLSKAVMGNYFPQGPHGKPRQLLGPNKFCHAVNSDLNQDKTRLTYSLAFVIIKKITLNTIFLRKVACRNL